MYFRLAYTNCIQFILFPQKSGGTQSRSSRASNIKNDDTEPLIITDENESDPLKSEPVS